MDVQAVLGRSKRLVRPMQWQRTLGGREAEVLGFEQPLQYVDEPESFPEALKVFARWRPRVGHIPESVQFGVLFRTNRIYALDAQPLARHKNNVGVGLPWHKQFVYGSHVHLWCAEGHGYAEPLTQFVDPIDVGAVWDYFLKGSGIEEVPFVHPDEGTHSGQGRLL
jgi:hypothetical protein